MYLFKNCKVYAPQPLGMMDLLTAGNRIIALEKELEPPKLTDLQVIDCSGLTMIPGLIDGHVHIAGAGGEGGPQTRTPELQISQLLEGGITTVIGCLGTDGFTRSIQSVLMKAKSIRQQGLSAWILTGSYQVPPPTILGDVGKDIALIEEIIGVGEIAISDHRSSCPTTDELIRLAAHARVGGMLGGKAGIVNLHLGSARHPFQPLIDAVEKSELTFRQFLPTHVNRSQETLKQAAEYGKSGYLDITASIFAAAEKENVKTAAALKYLLAAGVPPQNITMSSDGCGSLPVFDEYGNFRTLKIGQPSALFRETIDAVLLENLPLETALLPVTANPAQIWKLPRKGQLKVGYDADLVLLNPRFKIVHLLANGRFFIQNGQAVD